MEARFGDTGEEVWRPQNSAGKAPGPLAGGGPEPPARVQGRAALTAPTFGFPPGSRGVDTIPTIPGGRSGNQLPMRRRGGDPLKP